MPQNELNRSVARATGESVGEIARMGFQIDGPPSFTHVGGTDLGPIDWDALESSRRCEVHRNGRPGIAFHQ